MNRHREGHHLAAFCTATLAPLLTTISLLGFQPHASAQSVSAGKLDYNYHIRPILADRCFVCHGPDEKNRKAKLRLDSSDEVVARGIIVPGKPDESLLVERITADAAERMPPEKSGLVLTATEIELLKRWIAEGAEYRPHWAFVPLPRAVPVPGVSDRHWPKGVVDRFVLARLERDGMKPSAAATREDWLRRVTFDLTGLPPTIDEIDSFCEDRSPDAFEKVVDRLLASPRYGERLALEWLDVARYADSFGYQADGDMHVWPWRDWVVRAFNENLPFDAFATWQLAGDLLEGATREQRLATAFCRLNRMTNEGGSIPEEFRCEYVSDRVHTLGMAFLALTLECARCHDHKYDPFTMKDYYSLSAFFNSIDEWGTYNHSNFRPTPTLALPTPDQVQTISELREQVAAQERELVQLRNARQAAFEDWLKTNSPQSVIPGLVGHYPFERVEPNHVLANVADPKHPGSTSPANSLVPGKLGKAIRFTGDDPVTLPGVLGSVDRHRPFTVAFWLQVAQPMGQGIVFHRMSGTDTGFNGVELSFSEGRLFFAFVRFWPGNAMAVQTRSTVVAQQWVHVCVRYDATGKADGLSVFLDGKPAETETIRDCLTKNVEGGGSGLVFGERFRSVGLKDGLLDDVRVYDRALSAIEIAQIADSKSLADAVRHRDREALEAYYYSTIDQPLAEASERLRVLRQKLFAAESAVFEIMTMQETPLPRPAFVLARGQYDAPRNRLVGRDTPSALTAFAPGAARDRLGLARWLTDPDHPLTARVAANRYWQMFFGRGFVATTENFGLQGALPTHAELFDWLARDFVSTGWDVKRLCRTIVLSATYRQRSAADSKMRERDPDNVLLARGPSRRLPAEMVRDAALFVGGLLSGRIGGPPVHPYQPPGLWRGQNAFLPEYVPDKGESLYRRSLYTFWRRTSPPPNMVTFDAPTREVCVVRRQATNTPLQPLVLLNDPQFVESARGLAERMLRRPGTDADRVAFAFRLTATRQPTDRERQILMQLFRDQRLLFKSDPDSAKRYVRVGDWPAPADLAPVDLAATTATASAILCLDAVLMTR